MPTDAPSTPTPIPPGNGHPAPARTNIGSGILADVASLWPDQIAPSAQDDAAPGSAGPAESAPTRAERAAPAEETPEPAATPAPALKEEPSPAPETLTLTQAELQERIAEATKRQRADQSAMAKQLSEMQRRLEARERAYAELARELQGTAAGELALRSWMLSENAATEAAQQAEQAQREAAQTRASLAREKAAVATTLYQEQYAPLLYEAGQLGVPQAELVAIIDGVLKSPDFAPFHEAFDGATSVQDAARVAKPGYVLLAKEVRARLQAKKLESLKEPDPPKAKPERTQAHGAGGGAVDPLDRMPIGQRGTARLREGLLQDAMRAYNLET